MVVRIGLVGQRADLALEVASLASRAGAAVLAMDPAEGRGAVTGPGSAEQVDLILVDVAWAEAARPGAPEVAGARYQPAAPSWCASRGILVPPAGSRPPVVVVCHVGETAWARDAAAALGGSHVVELPLGAPWLVSQLVPEPGAPVLAVVGAVGGVGASTVSIACAVGAGADCLLVDADPDSAGLDLPLGIPEGAGVRWPGIPDSPNPLDPGSLRAALPAVERVCVVTGGVRNDRDVGALGADEPGVGRLAGVLGVGRVEFGRTVVDAGRGALATGVLGPGDAVVLVLPATLAGVVAGRRVLDRFPDQQVVALLRPTGWLPADEVAEQLGVPVALEVPRLRQAAELADCGDLLSGRTGRALRSLGEQVWGQLA